MARQGSKRNKPRSLHYGVCPHSTAPNCELSSVWKGSLTVTALMTTKSKIKVVWKGKVPEQNWSHQWEDFQFNTSLGYTIDRANTGCIVPHPV